MQQLKLFRPTKTNVWNEDDQSNMRLEKEETIENLMKLYSYQYYILSFLLFSYFIFSEYCTDSSNSYSCDHGSIIGAFVAGMALAVVLTLRLHTCECIRCILCF